MVLTASIRFIYQAFSLLSGNRQVLLQPCVTEIADRHDKSVSQVSYRLALELGMLPLTGTTDGTHMRHNLDIFDFTLSRDETATLHPPCRSAMGFVPKNHVRTRFAAGGSRIRTLGSRLR